jgi:hypothetical protein
MAVSLAGLMCSAGQAADPSIVTYRAVYQVEYKGKALGTSQFTVSYDADRDLYRFESRTIAKGLLKLVSPNPVVERSEFRAVGGVIQPLEFWYEDGSRKGEDNLHVVFQWDTRIAIIDGEHGRTQLDVAPGVLDRGSLQVALMRDLARTGRPDSYQLADADSVKPYVYTSDGEQPIATGIGELKTLALVQQREGSSRSTLLWMAVDHDYVPARIEQRRNGEVQTAFTLDTYTRLD